ncbi:MAG: hypothetical protein J7619_23180 [Dyadobacter sp.]|uniref:hypothetical protein n=1 Tax=Dyadobacter sp. TaxID=1914288 RepID=UPI001B0F4DE8|nr:hypothetical protein [Dyadobacter sp.]MBO9615619.1 hypothetical protein [Dyadobacter sp.]
MNNLLPDPALLNELFDSEGFQAAVSAGDKDLARDLFYLKLFPGAKQLSSKKVLDEAELIPLLSGAFDRPLMPGLGVNKGEYFEITLSPMTVGDRAVARLYFDGRITAEFDKNDLFILPEIKPRISETDMRARILAAGYFPS